MKKNKTFHSWKCIWNIVWEMAAILTRGRRVKTRTTRTPAFWGYPPPPHDYPRYWIPSQKNNRSRTENVTEQTRFSKSRSNDLEDIGQGQRSSHATHLLMLVIICTKYGKNPSRTVDATERTRFSRSTPSDLEDIGQGQRHLLMLVIICTKYGKNPSRTVDATETTRFSRSRPNDLKDMSRSKVIMYDTSSHAGDHLYQIWKESIKNCRCYREDTIFKVKAEWPWRYRSRSQVIMCNTSSHAGDHLYQIWKESIKNCRCYREDTIFKVKAEWPWRYRSRSKVIICDTPSHASDHLC